MPVLITGATGLIGRAVAKRLLTEGAQVRAYLRRDDPELRAIGVHIALGPIDDVPRLEAALTRVHTIVHLVGSVWPERGVGYDAVNRDSTEAAAIAARAADVRRFLFLSFPGADPDTSNEFLRAKGRAEEHVRAAGLEHAIFRCAPVFEGLAATFARLARGPVLALPGDGRQRLNPVALSDVVSALVAADVREASVGGTFELGGPETFTLDEVARRVLPDRRITHVTALSRAPRTFTDVYGRDMLADPAAAVSQFGLSLTPAAR